eukprot:2391451-Rhodomonas_salina.3
MSVSDIAERVRRPILDVAAAPIHNKVLALRAVAVVFPGSTTRDVSTGHRIHPEIKHKKPQSHKRMGSGAYHVRNKRPALRAVETPGAPSALSEPDIAARALVDRFQRGCDL